MNRAEIILLIIFLISVFMLILMILKKNIKEPLIFQLIERYFE
jgi:hypothetical protein